MHCATEGSVAAPARRADPALSNSEDNRRTNMPGNTLIRKISAAGAVSASVLLAACSAVQTTSSGTVGVNRTQYMSGMVSEAALQDEAAKQYSSLMSQAKRQGALDEDATQTARVKKIATRLIKQVGVFRPDASGWNWEV